MALSELDLFLGGQKNWKYVYTLGYFMSHSARCEEKYNSGNLSISPDLSSIFSDAGETAMRKLDLHKKQPTIPKQV